MAEGIDCSAPLTAKTAALLAREGRRFAARYLVPVRYAWKRLTLEEARAITAAGMQIVSVFETTANRPAGGAAAGQADGAAAYKEAKKLGQPEGTAIYFAVDYDAGPAHHDEIEQYLRAAATQIPGYHTGVYGSYTVIEEMAKRSACRHFWQTYAWSRGKKSAKANIYQYRNDVRVAGIAVDLNESYGNEGWWNTDGPSPEEPKEEPEEEGEKPTMTAEDANKIILFLQAGWQIAKTQADKDEFHRLANEVRKAAGLPVS